MGTILIYTYPMHLKYQPAATKQRAHDAERAQGAASTRDMKLTDLKTGATARVVSVGSADAAAPQELGRRLAELGFLPGDLKEKVDPYLRPLYDALGESLDDATVGKYLERGVIEVAPLAYMRGRTLSDAYVILDEAQNASREQLKMFLTRLGSGSKMIVSGDVTQIDLPRGAQSGLAEVERIFSGIDDVGIVRLNESDIVRHPLIAKLVAAYQRAGDA